jgi:oxygen-independent coproporphyrinogen-3 oxidase
LYVRSLSERKIPAVQETLKKSDQINEYILTSLRTDNGCNMDILKGDFQYDLNTRHGGYIRQLQSHNLVSLQPPHLRLTEAGRLLADKIASDLFLIE